ncbi:DUF4198 domain-containing protein [Antribacter sp. KLBMP9083]|uniref:DUF4198 domain-containing protein n=1 Tax=Antribacter soli TaxID=2910976 RepID=A0AA41QGE2_9MICO|nr:DUF4198 domain-containing protein [Antribacter soli]MCF4122633.1 DUF4198 domain-containing protein [Antribacter soli]
MNRRTVATAGRVLALTYVVGLLTGCGTGSGYASCSPTELVADDVTVATESEAFALAARLTADGRPVEGAELEFFPVYRDPEGAETAMGGGAGTTDADGRATYEYTGGSRTMLGASDDVLLGYTAEYRAPRPIGGTEYCPATTERAVLDVPCAGLACLLDD